MSKYTLVGVDSNAYSIMGYVKNAMKKEGISGEDIKKYTDEAMSSDYQHLLFISAKIIDKLNEGKRNFFETEKVDKILKDYTEEEIKKQEELTSELYKKYVPIEGQGNNRISQILVAYSKLAYKWYNDGDVYDNTYALNGWCNDISGSANWLYKYIPETQKILEQIKYIKTEDEYSNLLRNLEFLLNNEEFLKKYENLEVLGDAYRESGPFIFDESIGDNDDEDCTGGCSECSNREQCELEDEENEMDIEEED